MRIKKVMFDLDGVITDFVKAICKLHGRPDPYENEEHHGNFDMDKIWQMPARDFWSPCGYEFWFGLEFTSEANRLLSMIDNVIGLDRCCILTSPCDTAGCTDGKRDWIKKHLPYFKKRVLIGSCKEFLASPDTLLIDDRDENIAKFLEHGGQAFTFPRPWNSGRFRRGPWDEQLSDVLRNLGASI